MLTLKQINEISFRKSNFSGYKPEDVDDFIDEVTESFTALLKENQAYKARVSELTEKNTEYKEKMVALAQAVEKYKKEEEGIKEALVTAQKLSNASLREAKRKADAMLADAKTEAEGIIADANSKTVDVVNDYEDQIELKQKELEDLKKSVSDFRTTLFGMYREHLELIEKLPEYSDEAAPAEEPETEDDSDKTLPLSTENNETGSIDELIADASKVAEDLSEDDSAEDAALDSADSVPETL